MNQDSEIEKFRSALLMLAQIQLRKQKLKDLNPSDLVQQTMLEAHRDRAKFRGENSEQLFAWLRMILHNNFLEMCAAQRAQKRDIGRKALEADLTQSFACLDDFLVGSVTSPSQRAMNNEMLVELANALEQLPEQQRTAVIMKHFSNNTLEEISLQLNVSIAATAGLLYRGRKRLQELLEERLP